MRPFAALLTGVALLSSAACAHAAPLFSDVGDVPARAAVESLSRQGVIEGYPDGTFKGDRAASRYEVALIVARIVTLEEKAHAGLATRAELNELKSLQGSLQTGTSTLQGRTQILESEVESLQQRIKHGGRNKIF